MDLMNKFYNLECVEGMKEVLKDDSIDLCVTSPPYDNLRDYKGYSFDFESVADELYRVIKPGGVVVWVVNDATIKGSETGTSLKQALYFKEIGFNLHDTMIYLKPGFSFPETTRYRNVFEYMFVFSKGKPKTFNPIKDRKNKNANKKVSGTDRQKDGSTTKIGKRKDMQEFGNRFNVWEINNTLKKDHNRPAIFPEQLATDHILSWSNEGDLILDPFAGSGTTLKCAKELHRNFVGFEISEEYCEIIEKRLFDE